MNRVIISFQLQRTPSDTVKKRYWNEVDSYLKASDIQPLGRPRMQYLLRAIFFYLGQTNNYVHGCLFFSRNFLLCFSFPAVLDRWGKQRVKVHIDKVLLSDPE